MKLNQKGAIDLALLSTLVAVVVIGGLVVWRVNSAEINRSSTKNNTGQGVIDSYEACVAAGYPVMESYPEQCAVPGGETFTRQLSKDEQTQLGQDEPSNDAPLEKPENISLLTGRTTLPGVPKNTHFTIDLPSGWEEQNVDPSSVVGSPEAFYVYTNEDGREIGVSVNSGGFGGGGDGQANFGVFGTELSIDSAFVECDPEQDMTGGCRYGDGKLELVMGSSVDDDGDSYLIWLIDNNDESQQAYLKLVKILETIKLI